MLTATETKPPIPLADNVVLLKLEPEEKSRGGILIPAITAPSHRQPQIQLDRGEVLAIGPGKRDQSGTVQPVRGMAVGQIVVYNTFAACNIELDGKKLVIVPEEGVVARLP
jgi:chaperonin GroES